MAVVGGWGGGGAGQGLLDAGRGEAGAIWDRGEERWAATAGRVHAVTAAAEPDCVLSPSPQLPAPGALGRLHDSLRLHLPLPAEAWARSRRQGSESRRALRANPAGGENGAPHLLQVAGRPLTCLLSARGVWAAASRGGSEHVPGAPAFPPRGPRPAQHDAPFPSGVSARVRAAGSHGQEGPPGHRLGLGSLEALSLGDSSRSSNPFTRQPRPALLRVRARSRPVCSEREAVPGLFHAVRRC